MPSNHRPLRPFDSSRNIVSFHGSMAGVVIPRSFRTNTRVFKDFSIVSPSSPTSFASSPPHPSVLSFKTLQPTLHTANRISIAMRAFATLTTICAVASGTVSGKNTATLNLCCRARFQGDASVELYVPVRSRTVEVLLVQCIKVVNMVVARSMGVF